MSIILIFKKFDFLDLKVKDVFDFPMGTLGIEPKTYGLKARRSANWAMYPYKKNSFIKFNSFKIIFGNIPNNIVNPAKIIKINDSLKVKSLNTLIYFTFKELKIIRLKTHKE